MDIVVLFPGQGSQIPGMGSDLAAAYPLARETFDAVDDAVGFRLSDVMFEGPAGELTRTENAQPALLAHGAAVWGILRERIIPRVRAAAGHSLGELTAHHAAGSLTLPAAARLVRRRGELMSRAGEERPGTMAALLGEIGETRLAELCAIASAESGTVVAANFNSPAQVVVSGEHAGVARVMALASAAGVKRAVHLPVSGAFHSPLMEPARDGLRQAIDASGLSEPAFPVISNVTAGAVNDAASARRLLLAQITAPVRWTATVQHLAAEYPDALFIEMGPGSVLTKLVRRTAPDVTAVSCGSADEIRQLLLRIA